MATSHSQVTSQNTVLKSLFHLLPFLQSPLGVLSCPWLCNPRKKSNSPKTTQDELLEKLSAEVQELKSEGRKLKSELQGLKTAALTRKQPGV
ncbi:hypothetical protein B0T16DRAFT_408241 [Cercophora newfieldiana]|uniref:Uncharacterized protein n=1 Tax=Cercophora newfieldiana TaxID=92897 RepID=A0AA40CT74_9PEZI|nr:hypothetical protein B0T16DRAFT_408241 [Cercophora newfieldiana]